MKLLSIIIPSYNSERFIAKCLDSLLIGLDEYLEVIVVNDGSTDRTSEIAHEYASKYDFIKAIDKENGGHGSAFNKGLEIATGLYFKILDSDDKLDKDGLTRLINTIKKHVEEKHLPDLYLADYRIVFENGGGVKNTIAFSKKATRVEDFITFNEIKNLGNPDFIMIHMTYMKTSFLRENHFVLLEKVFYEDAELVFYLIKYANELYVIDKPIYLYTIGRDGQSVSLESANKNYPSYFKVIDKVFSSITYDELKAMDKGRQYNLIHELYLILATLFFYAYMTPSKEKSLAYKEFQNKFKTNNEDMYKYLKYHTKCRLYYMVPPFLRPLATKIGYKYARNKGVW